MPSLTEITRIQELIYEFPISRVMTHDVVVVRQDNTITELKNILRIKRISGVPVVEEKHLVGIISIEDLIKALEVGDVTAPVSAKMTRDPIAVHPDESVVEAIKKFARYQVGRLPVVNDRGDLVGILTSGDITRGLLEAIGLDDHPQESKRIRRRIFEGIESDQTRLTLRYRIRARDFKSGGSASSRMKRALDRVGVSRQTQRRLAIATYEAEMNLVIHTDNGGEITAEIEPSLIHVSVSDTGPGIPDVDQAMQAGYSTAPDWIRELGFGAGMGLANIRRCADKMTLDSKVGIGTSLDFFVFPPTHHHDDAAAPPERKGPKHT